MLDELSNLISFIGGRLVITDVYTSQSNFIANPIIKIIIIVSILYTNLKDLKIAIAMFFVYILFIENINWNNTNTANDAPYDPLIIPPSDVPLPSNVVPNIV